MAASAGKILVRDFAFKVGGNPVGFSTGATFNITRAVNNAPPNSGDGNYQSATYGMGSWTAQVDSLLDDEGALIAADDLAVTVGGSPKALCLEGATVTISVGMQTITSTCGGAWQEVRPNVRAVTITANSIYYDPNATGTSNDATEIALDELLQATSAGLPVTVSFNSFSLSFDAKVSGGSVGGTQPDVVKAPWTFQSDGAVTIDVGDMDTALAALFNSVFASTVSSSVSVEAGGPGTGSAKLAGSGYVSGITMNLPYRTAQPSTSITITGNGALTEGTQS